MAAFVTNIPTPARVLTEAEQAALLKVTGEHRYGFRDHMIIALALGTGLREHELAGLDIGDVAYDDGRIRRRVALRVFKRSNDDPAIQEIVLPETLRTKLAKLLRWKQLRGESIEPAAPLFISRKRNRLSTRQMRTMFRTWQKRAGFERPYTFHSLRHTACTNLYRLTKDIRLTQRLARHKDIRSTQRYAHPSIEDLVLAVQALPC